LNTEADFVSPNEGSEHNDLQPDGTTKTNLSGGIRGGISNGYGHFFRVALNR
jgi:chorismate synthase